MSFVPGLQRRTLIRAGFVVLVIAVLGYLPGSFGDDEPNARAARMEKELSEKRARVAELTQANQKLARKIDALRNDPNAIIDIARQDLGWVRPTDQVFVIKNGAPE